MTEPSDHQDPRRGTAWAQFESELKALLNRHSMEWEAGIPDFILARHLTDCLWNLNSASNMRDKWYRVRLRPGEVKILPQDIGKEAKHGV